ncbi:MULTISPECIES: TetR family transcriptional regulator [Rhodococcus]|uniref:TetR family transcriptional regulator n=1 Tax=Rhodococcus oxybenzonivorans TaxID=1990687 RepID=A0AAE4V116_9NOCA|nr:MULTISPECIES: TetR family transcriptional regulator [Rhodococcus]MDV7245308.1 TetR family transcriptional regulator [Rhodococcus oxybenzonivorans]MDV7266119.1 TetR family transcriptional regulator [Rhodococcus oxybenzonivorans]MDV7272412.1 TetR family transcriptional regulator [Rhodococcus oxybenzonivorans]MDV7336333.1 TetR family transcriptional regulator [Rhodococcus oxybenzonivorans]MDV7347633.1 TetR family transcriptional regulator [Rhodococcus oxybenzonivorans]
MTRLDAFPVSPHLPAGQPGLRERRREQTNVEISETALTLFEHKGVEATTVGEIAQAAGVSQRTFFRYFATKEEAALRDHWAFEAVLTAGLDRLDSDMSPRLALETSFAAALATYSDSSSIASRRLLRVNKLIKKEPTLRAVLARASVARNATLVDAVSKRFDCSELQIRLAVDVSIAVLRAALETWVDRSSTDEAANLPETYSVARTLAYM